VVKGEIKARCELSGLPDVNITFFNPQLIEDYDFHACVRFDKWHQNKCLSFIPPDGKFTLMSYRASNVQMPLFCKPQITYSESGGRIEIMVGSKVGSGKIVDNLSVTIPFSDVVSSIDVTPTHGKVTFDEITKVCVWAIGRISTDDRSPVLSGRLIMVTGAQPPKFNPYISLNWSIPNISISGLKVDNCTVTNVTYKSFKGVKYRSYAGNIQIRS